MSKRKQQRKPGKSRKPITSRKAIQESNRKLHDHVVKVMQEGQKHLSELEGRVADSNQQLWNNQQQQKEGLEAAEQHVMVLRRVLNDALGGVTRVRSVERPVHHGAEETEKVQLIDWDWYAEQLVNHEDKQAFMDGVVLTDEQVEEAKKMQEHQMRVRKVTFLALEAHKTDEAQLQKIFDEGTEEELVAHLKGFVKKGVEWEDEFDALAPEAVDKVLEHKRQEKAQAALMERRKAEGILSSLADQMVQEHGLVEDELAEMDCAKVLKAALPDRLEFEWKGWMDREAEGIIRQAIDRAETLAKAEENDPEEVRAAAEELLAKTKEFAGDAGQVIKLIEAGKMDHARKLMALLEQRVEEQEAEARQTEAQIPDGAAVFGGS